jgi:hypothetical protein
MKERFPSADFLVALERDAKLMSNPEQQSPRCAIHSATHF